MRSFTPALVVSAVLLGACEPEVATPEAPATPTPSETAAPASPPADRADVASPSAPTPAPSPASQGGDDWRSVAANADASALGHLDQAWRMARAEAEDKGFADKVEALGPLVDPNAALGGRLQPAPGGYRCRTIKMGTRSEDAGLAYVEYPWLHCRVEMTPDGDLVLTKVDGSQRTRGLLYPDTDRRLVFVGAQAWGADEAGYPNYGQTPERDQIGAFERIGDQRWRLVLPWPKQESKLDILELRR